MLPTEPRRSAGSQTPLREKGEAAQFIAGGAMPPSRADACTKKLFITSYYESLGVATGTGTSVGRACSYPDRASQIAVFQKYVKVCPT